MADQMRPTPRGFISGLFSDVLGRTLNMPSMPRTGIPSLDLLYANRNSLFNAAGVGDVQKTAERISYGQPLTTGSGMTLRPREEAINAAMTVAPLIPSAGRVGRTVGRLAGEEINAAMTGQPTRSLLGQMTPKPKQIFIGESAKTWDKANAEKFLQLEKSGVDPVDAWKQTGTFRSPDGKLRQEISDNPARWQPAKWDQPYQEAPEIDRARVQEALSHPELFKAYPQLGQADIFLNPNLDSLAQWQRANPNIGTESFMQLNQTVNPSVEVDWLKRLQDPNSIDYWKNQARYGIKEGFTPREAILDMRQHMADTQEKIDLMNRGVIPSSPSNALHELQHGVQEIEGFAGGGNPTRLSSDISQAKYELQAIKDQMTQLQDKASDEARYYISKSQQDPEFKQFVDEAFNKYKKAFGEKSADNPYGVDLQDAVKYHLLDTQGHLENLGTEADRIRKLSNLTPDQAYRRLAGEAEARAVQKRMGMTPEQRLETFPIQSYDLPVNDLLYRDPFTNLLR